MDIVRWALNNNISLPGDSRCPKISKKVYDAYKNVILDNNWPDYPWESYKLKESTFYFSLDRPTITFYPESYTFTYTDGNND